MVTTKDDERIETLLEVLEKMDEIAEALRSLHDPQIDAYCLADFEGQEGGWLGEFVRDILQRKVREYRDGDPDADGEDAQA